MGTIWIKELTGGLDSRRLPETTPGGVLIKGNNGHITRGGEFEQRADFVTSMELPAGTVGLSSTRSGLFVFGTEAEPAGMPSGVSYQQLEHPTTPALALSRILSADAYDSKLYVAAEYVDGSIVHFYDGVYVSDWFDGRARASFTIDSGTAGAKLETLTINGTDALGGAVTWVTTPEDTAAAIASAINSYVSAPEYGATSVGDRVNIIANTAGSGPNGYSVNATVSGGLVVSPATGVVLANGSDSESFTPGTFVKTVRTKEYSVAGSLLHFSGIQEPTKWTTDTTGAGFINLSTEDADATNLTALARYQSMLAVFAPTVTMIWYIDPDPDLNTLSQVLANTGTKFPRSVAQFGDSDVFYLDTSGLRSLRARDSSNAAATTDIGVPIDTLVTAKMEELTSADTQRVISLINPIDKRFWLIIKDVIYVFSFYQNAKVSAWTTYEPGFTIDAATVFNERVYVRSGNDIYAYGGVYTASGGISYSADVEAEAWLPYLDANRPTAKKNWQGVDFALTGLWEVSAALNPTDVDSAEVIARAFKTSYNQGRIPLSHSSSHISLRFKSKSLASDGGPAILSSANIHYEGNESED